MMCKKLIFLISIFYKINIYKEDIVLKRKTDMRLGFYLILQASLCPGDIPK